MALAEPGRRPLSKLRRDHPSRSNIKFEKAQRRGAAKEGAH